MKQRFVIAAAAMLACIAAPVAGAQPVLRLKARLVGFDGQVMTLQPLAGKAAPAAPIAVAGAKPGMPATASKPDDAKPDATPDNAPLMVAVLPETKYVATAAADVGALKVGDYVGAAVSEGRGGKLRAQEIYTYADALRGTGEGRFSDNGRLLINGTVSAATFGVAPAAADGMLTLHYRGAVMNAAAPGRTVCEGRALPPTLMSALACAADAAIEVKAGTPVSSLTIGDRSLLTPGAVVTVSVTRTPDGKQVSPGVVIEKPAIAAKPDTVEKPQSPQ